MKRILLLALLSSITNHSLCADYLEWAKAGRTQKIKDALEEGDREGLNKKDASGFTALDWAYRVGGKNSEMFRDLKRAGAKPSGKILGLK